MQGDLRSAWRVLSEHSELRANSDSTDYRKLKDMLLSHPSLQESLSVDDFESTKILPFVVWSQLVHQVRISQIAIVDFDMGPVFDLLEGKLKKPDLLTKFTRWEEYALSQLLYADAAPHSHNTILKAFDEAMALLSQNNPISELNGRIVSGIIRNESGPLIRTLVGHHASLSDRGRGGASLISLLSTANLTQLIDLTMSASGQGGIDGGVTWPQNDVGIVEELFLQSAELLDAVGTPLEVVVSYCMACPNHGMSYAHAFIVHRDINSDQSLMASCSLLESLGLLVSCRVLSSSRGTWWLKSCGNHSKAIHFYCIAGDYSRASALAEEVLWNLILAVEHGGRVKLGPFKDLRIRCARPPTILFSRISTVSDEKEMIAIVKNAMKFAANALAAYESSSSMVSYEKEVFFANTKEIFDVLQGYLRLVEGIMHGGANVPDHIRYILHRIGRRKVPLRFCLHFVDICILADLHINGESLHSSCLKEDVEFSLIILNRALSSPHASTYLADTPPDSVRELSSRALNLLARSIITSNAILKNDGKVDERKRADDGKPKKLLSCILAS